MTKKIIGLALAVVSGSFAQYGYPSNGGYGNNGSYGGSGKCTVEVEIDQAADVMVTGTNVQLRNLGGGPPMLVRTNCSSPLPPSPAGFQFKGIDGRGRQTLIADPVSGRGTAVVRLEDPANGRERYTFDLIWQGSNGGYNTGTYSNGAYGYPSNGYPTNGYPNNGYPANGGNYPVYGNNYPTNGYPVYGNTYPNNGYPNNGSPVYGNTNPVYGNSYPNNGQVYRTPQRGRNHRDNDGDADDYGRNNGNRRRLD